MALLLGNVNLFRLFEDHVVISILFKAYKNLNKINIK